MKLRSSKIDIWRAIEHWKGSLTASAAGERKNFQEIYLYFTFKSDMKLNTQKEDINKEVLSKVNGSDLLDSIEYNLKS